MQPPPQDFSFEDSSPSGGSSQSGDNSPAGAGPQGEPSPQSAPVPDMPFPGEPSLGEPQVYPPPQYSPQFIGPPGAPPPIPDPQGGSQGGYPPGYYGQGYGPQYAPPNQPGSALIPLKNPTALIAYYLAVFALIPCLGMLLAPVAFVLGIIGLNAAKKNPQIKGVAHAWVGIILGGLIVLAYVGLFVLGAGSH